MATREPITPDEAMTMMVTPKGLGELIKAKRLSLNWSKYQLAERLRVHVKTVQKWEDGVFDPNFVRLVDWILENDTTASLFRKRAQLAEATIKDIAAALRAYREEATRRGPYENRELSRPKS